MKKSVIAVIVAAIVIIIILGLGSRDSQPVAGKEPIKIGGISALTGVGVPTGEEERNGALLAVKEINENGGIDGHPIEFISEDVSIDKLGNGASVAQKLIAIDKVVAIVGPQWDEPGQVVAPIAEEKQVPVISPDATPGIESENNFDYFFSTWFDNEVGIRELLRFSEKNGWKRIAIIQAMPAGFWKYTHDLFLKNAPNYDVEIVEDFIRNEALSSVDFRTNILRVRESKPDAAFVVLGDFNICPFLRQAGELQMKAPLLLTEAASSHAVLEDCPGLMENGYIAMPKPSEKYVELYKEEYGRSPEYPSSITAYDAVYILKEALEKTNLVGGQKLRDAIANTKYEKGLSTPLIKFNDKGFHVTPEDAFEIWTVRDGMFTNTFEVK